MQVGRLDSGVKYQDTNLWVNYPKAAIVHLEAGLLTVMKRGPNIVGITGSSPKASFENPRSGFPTI